MLVGAGFGIISCIIGSTGQSINQIIVSGDVFGSASGFQDPSHASIQEIFPNKHRMLGVGRCLPPKSIPKLSWFTTDHSAKASSTSARLFLLPFKRGRLLLAYVFIPLRDGTTSFLLLPSTRLSNETLAGWEYQDTTVRGEGLRWFTTLRQR
jgi:hypothetical protein